MIGPTTLIGLVAAAAFAAAGLYVLGFGLICTLRALRSRGWPSVPGRVVDIAVREQPTREGVKYVRKFIYRYTVHGRAYTATRVRFGDELPSNWDRRIAFWLAGRYPTGIDIPVYFDPRKPALSVLERGFNGKILGIVLLGLLFAGGSITAILTQLGVTLPDLLRHLEAVWRALDLP